MSGRILVVLVALVASTAALDILQSVLSQCNTIKSLLGISYDKVESSNKTLDVTGLRLNFASGGFNISYEISSAASDILADNHYNTSQKLYVFVHGWNSDSTGSHGIINALYDSGKSNVLALDSSTYLKNWNYLQCSLYVKFVGEKLAEVLIALSEAGLHRKNIHIIGHSLGAQIGSFAGLTYQRLTSTKIGRITGLDPAGPCFSEMSDDYKLTADDAEFVDVIHSNAGIAGIKDPVGHVDFYPNGGTNQPGCFIVTCDHGRSMTYFTESITNPEAFLARKCDSWDEFGKEEEAEEGDTRYMGFHLTNTGVNGSYYLRTDKQAPFGLGALGLTKATNPFANFFSLFGKK